MYYLKFKRMDYNYKQADVAELVGISLTILSRIENGKRSMTETMTYDEIEKLAGLYDMSIDQLISEYRKDLEKNKNKKYKGGISNEQVRKNVSN